MHMGEGGRFRRLDITHHLLHVLMRPFKLGPSIGVKWEEDKRSNEHTLECIERPVCIVVPFEFNIFPR